MYGTDRRLENARLFFEKVQKWSHAKRALEVEQKKMIELSYLFIRKRSAHQAISEQEVKLKEDLHDKIVQLEENVKLEEQSIHDYIDKCEAIMSNNKN